MPSPAEPAQIPAVQAILAVDPWLAPYAPALAQRYDRYLAGLKAFAGPDGNLAGRANGHLYFGAHPTADGWVFREAAPSAKALYLIGDFNGWERRATPYRQLADGTWECVLHAADLSRPLGHGSRVKIHVISAHGAEDRLSPYARRVVQDPQTHDFSEELWNPKTPYQWRNRAPLRAQGEPLLIYEAHVGMAQERADVGTFAEFRDEVLPRIAKAGYNALQLMALAEHPYYGSFGYHVANFFAPSSRFGTPDDLKSLVDTAHGLGLAVYMDVVHAHAAANTREGLAGFDGTEHQFFHAGPRGHHPLWGSRLFNYGSPSVCHFLLSNLKAWMTDYQLDGFRFDGVTSMLYLHHGLETAFDCYDRYFGEAIDDDAVTYLQLANQLVHELRPDAVTIAEDVSGLPGLALPLGQAGLGFDYRLAMGLPDFWFQLVRTQPDETWRPSEMLRALTNRRPGEKVIAYVESHDQAMVGDKTMAFTLMDKAMYDHMSRGVDNVVVQRGIALHKMLRLFTVAAGGDGYLTFMGNEFGHPEWIDFPREGNGWSYAHARRQWSLADRSDLLYQALANFDRAMLVLAKNYPWMSHANVETLLVDDGQQLVVFRRGATVFAFNFHPDRSAPNLTVKVPEAWLGASNPWRLVLSSDDTAFGGFHRQDSQVCHPVVAGAVQLYLPCRTGAVYTT